MLTTLASAHVTDASCIPFFVALKGSVPQLLSAFGITKRKLISFEIRPTEWDRPKNAEMNVREFRTEVSAVGLKECKKHLIEQGKMEALNNEYLKWHLE